MSRDAYLEAFYKNRKPTTLDNVSPFQHKPLDEQLGHSVSEGEVAAFNRDTENRGFVLPFDKYIGPGNSVNRGDPESEADAIAQEHDLRYFDAQYRYSHGEIDEATAEKEISDSDIDAINKFGQSGTFTSTLGHDGLQFKHLGEKVIGQQYPRFTKTKDSSISGNMPKQIKERYKAQFEQLSADQQRAYRNHPSMSYMFDEISDNPTINRIDQAAAKEGFKRPGGVAKPFIDAKRSKPTTSTENETSKPHPAQATETSGTFEVDEPIVGPSTDAQSDDLAQEIDPTQAQPTKTIKPEISAATSSTDIEMGLPGTGQGSGGSGDGNANNKMMVYEPERPLTLFGKKMSTYRKVHRFLTFGIAPVWISRDLTTPTENQRYLTTALAEIPWEYPLLYMTQSEFDLLPVGSYVKEVRVRVVHRGNRIAFETGEVATRLATLNQIQNIHIGFGLNKTGWGNNVTYTAFDATNPMKPTAVGAPTYNTYDENFYGLSNADANFAVIIPTHQIGSQYPLTNYFSLINAVQNFGGVPPLAENLQFMDGKTTINQEVASFKYNPKIAPIKVPLKHIRSGLPLMTAGAAALVIHTNGCIENTFNASITGTQDATGATQANNQIANAIQNNSSSGQFTLFDPIEKSQFMKQGPWGQYQNPSIQPSLHIGIQAIPSLSSQNILSPITNYTDCQADWDVFCEMDIVEHTPTKLPYATQANVPAGEVIYRTQQVFPETDACTYAGLYPNNAIR